MPARSPARWTHPVPVVFLCGLVAAAIGWSTGGATFGTGYEQAAGLINVEPHGTPWFGIVTLVAVLSCFAGIPRGI
ncbi:hypothetical protein [Cupriavidus basilensis]